MRIKKILPVIEKLELTDTGAEGQAVGRAGSMAVFVKNAVPGDVADVQLTRKKRSYAEGKVIHFHKLSGKRTAPKCAHFGVCGGCKWQHMDYEAQLYFKQQQVKNTLTRIGRVEIPRISPIIGSRHIYYYRNKLEFTFSDKGWLTEEEIKTLPPGSERNALGFHIPGLFDKVLDIKECYLQPEPSDAIRWEIKHFALENNFAFFNLKEQKGLLRNLIIRTASTGETMVLVVFYSDDKTKREKLLSHIAEKFPTVTSLMYVINPKRNDTLADLEIKLFSGRDHIFEQMEELKFRISPASFYQTNSAQAYELYKLARKFADLMGTQTVYDLYTGTGTIANFIAGRAKKVIGIEYNADAVADARVNAAINGISNISFFSGDIKDVLDDQFIKENGRPDVIITDPPRGGMHKDVVEKINQAEPQIIVYISCNPATQARDIGLLAGSYRVTAVQPVDMFPHTAHVENVVKLEKKK